MDSIETDFLIVGGGVAGPALAAALATTDYRSVLIERSAAPADTARGDHLQPHTLEILERWGVLSNLFANGAEKRTGARWCRPCGDVVLDVTVAGLDIPHPYFAFLNHERISATLLDAAGRGNSTLLRPVRGFTVTERTKTRIVAEVTRGDGSAVQVTARVLAGADGRNSRVRRLMNCEVESHRYERPIAVLFGSRRDPGPDNALMAYFTAGGILAAIPRTGGGCKLGIAVAADELAGWRSAGGVELGARLTALAPGLDVDNVHYGGVYPPVHLHTDRWVEDNVILIGDACHAMHPARSQGMNLSIRCVDELVRHLPGGSGPLNPALSAYEIACRPGIDTALEQNHRAGLEFDDPDPERLEAAATALAQIASNPEALQRYALASAGYDVH